MHTALSKTSRTYAKVKTFQRIISAVSWYLSNQPWLSELLHAAMVPERPWGTWPAGPYGGADLQYFDLEPDIRRSCKTVDMEASAWCGYFPGEQPVLPLITFLHLFRREPLMNNWHRFLTGKTPFQLPKQQCQSNERNSKHWTQTGQITHCSHPFFTPATDSWWYRHCAMITLA